MSITVETSSIESIEVDAFRCDCFAVYTPAQQNWEDVAVQCLYRSTWDGLGSAVSTSLQIVAEAIMVVFSVFLGVIGLFLCCSKMGREWIGLSCWMTPVLLSTVLISVKNLIYHTIRAVPIVGYPISQGINWAAERLYAIECIQNQLQAYKELLDS